MRNGKKSVLVINGPNLNLLGTREPHLYGHETLNDIENAGVQQGKDLDANVEFFQRYAVAYLTCNNHGDRPLKSRALLVTGKAPSSIRYRKRGPTEQTASS
jgi:hypothetical protein